MLSFFPRGVSDEILNLIESVSEEFPSYSNDCTSVSDHFPLSLVEEGYDIRSRTQLSKEQHKDPEISPIFQKNGQ